MKSAKINNGWLLAGLFNGLQKISIPVFGILSTMILAHKALTKSEMGVWSLFLVITSFVEIVRQTLVKTSLIKFLNHSTEEEHKFVLSAALFLNSFVTVILVAVLFIFAPFLSAWLKAPALTNMMYIFFPGMLLLIPFSHFEWIMYSKSQFKGLFWTFLFRQGLSLLLIVVYIVLFNKVSLNQLVLFYCAGILIGIFIAYNYVKIYLERTFVLSYKWVLQLWHFGKYVFGTGLSSMAFSNAAQISFLRCWGVRLIQLLKVLL